MIGCRVDGILHCFDFNMGNALKILRFMRRSCTKFERNNSWI